MHDLFPRLELDLPHYPDSIPLQAVLLYDDTRDGQRAMRVLEGIAAGRAREFRLNPVLWCFESLNRILSRCRAGDDLAAADLVIIALSDANPMPPAIERWMRECLERNTGHSVTVLTLRGESDACTIVVRDERGVLKAPAAATTGSERQTVKPNRLPGGFGPERS